MIQIRRLFILGLAVAALAAGAASAADSPDAILGTWLIQDGSAKVQITGADGVFSGHVVWLKEPDFAANAPDGLAGKPKTDRLNSDASLRSRPVMGLVLLSGLRYAGNNSWDHGSLYSPSTGKSYACKATLSADGALKLTVGGSVFGRSVTWTRASP